MGAKFFKRTTPTVMVNPNPLYKDLYDNNKLTYDIQAGTVNNVRKSSLTITDFLLPSLHTYGESTLVGAKVGYYVNSITAGDGSTSAGLRAFKLKTNICSTCFFDL